MKSIKKLWILTLIPLMIACNQESEEGLRKQISEKKKEISELSQEVNELQSQLDGMSATRSGNLVPIRIQEVQSELFEHYFEVTGAVEALEEAYISPEISGRIKAIHVVDGQNVKKGQLLVELNSEVTRNSINELQSQIEFVTTVYEKQKRLWEKGIGSELQYLEAKNNKQMLENKLSTTQAQLDMSQIRSPFSGIVDQVYSKTGELAMPGVQIMQIVNLSELKINADVSESYLQSVHQGEVAEISFPVFPDLILKVPVSRIGNVINPQNRTFNIQLMLSNTDNLLKPNILAIIRLNDFSSEAALLVPSEIVKQDMQGQYLYILDVSEAKDVARKKYVETGLSYANKTMITQGLNQGDRVVVQGYNQVSDGTEVNVND